jgi:predicted extracellular nuclease
MGDGSHLGEWMQHRSIRYAALTAVVLACNGCGFPGTGGSQTTTTPMDAGRLHIGQIQGSAPISPMLGQQVLIEGVVVRSLAGDGDDIAQEMGETLGEGNRGRVVGWFVQDEGDNNPATSDALFVLDQGYDTGINMPAVTEFTMRMGTRVRSGDRVVVRGEVVELAQAQAADQPRSAGHPVARGVADGTVTAIAASSITLLEPGERALAIQPQALEPALAGEERVEGMRLSRIDTASTASQPPAQATATP